MASNAKEVNALMRAYDEGRHYELMTIHQTMKDFIDINRREYGGGCIEAYCDAMSDLEDWLDDRVKEQNNG